jgi:hypothetical protein
MVPQCYPPKPQHLLILALQSAVLSIAALGVCCCVSIYLLDLWPRCHGMSDDMIISLTTDSSFALKNVLGTRCMLKPAAQFQDKHPFATTFSIKPLHVYFSRAESPLRSTSRKLWNMWHLGFPNTLYTLLQLG